MDQVAAVAVQTAPFLIEVVALLRLVLHIRLLVSQQLGCPVRELALGLVRTVPHHDELFAKLAFLFAFLRVEYITAMSGLSQQGAWIVFKLMRPIDCWILKLNLRLEVEGHPTNIMLVYPKYI